MQFAVDILLLAVFGLLAFLGWRRGFLKTVFSLGKLVLALILTILLGPSVAAWLDVTFVNPPVYEAVHEKFSALAAEAAATAQGSIDGLIQRIPAVFRGYLDVSRVDPSADIYALADEWSLTVAGGISKVIATVIGYVLLFVVLLVVLSVVAVIVTKLLHVIPLLKTTDHLLGLALGAVSGIIAVLLLSTVLGALLSVTGQEALVESSFMLRISAGIRNAIFG
jgi:uncharacterized membrane protein required for colicin V production